MSEGREFVSSLSILVMIRWAIFMVTPLFLVLGIMGYALIDWIGVLLAFLFSLLPLALFLFGVTRVRVSVLCDERSLQLRYADIVKEIPWSEIKSVTLARSLFWRNLVQIESAHTSLIINMNLQPKWRELVQLLSSRIPNDRLKNFQWAEFSL